MNKYLFRFGFQRPEYLNTDFEDCACIWVEAVDSEEALQWGANVAEAFILSRYPEMPSWKDGEYSHWIEDDPKVLDWAVKNAPQVKVGQLPSPWPDFEDQP